jgi:hypothetical protein
MKKIIALLVMLMAILILILPATAEEVSDTPPTRAETLIGVWRSLNCDDFYVFNENGFLRTPSYTERRIDTIRWSIEGDELRIGTARYTFAIEGEILTLSTVILGNERIKVFEFYSDDVEYYYHNPRSIERNWNQNSRRWYGHLINQPILLLAFLTILTLLYKKNDIRTFVKKREKSDKKNRG